MKKGKAMPGLSVKEIKEKPIKKVAQQPEKKPKKQWDIDLKCLLLWIHRLHTGTYVMRNTPQAFANKIVTECIKLNGKELTPQEASQLIINKEI